MKSVFLLILASTSLIYAEARNDRKSRLDSDPKIIHLADVSENPIKLRVVKQAPVFSDSEGNRRLGYLQANQTVELEEMTDKVYRVRGKGTRNGLAGWVAPWAFSHPEDDFVEKLGKLYERQISVNAYIDAGEIALGMSPEEVLSSQGEPTKTSMRRTSKGESGTWSFIQYEEIKHYVTQINPLTGQAFRQLSHITQEEIGKIVVEFESGIVTAIEESEDTANRRTNVRIVVPPLILGW